MPTYVDTSVLVAIAFGEPEAPALRRLMRRQGALFASELLAAEFLAAVKREGASLAAASDMLAALSWVVPARTLRPEISRVLAVRYLRGADTWHLACACYLTPEPAELAFFTRDEVQRTVAAQLGFPTP